MKPIKKWSKFVAWAMRYIGKDLKPKVYALHNDPKRKTYVAIAEGYCNLYIIAFTEIVTRKKGNCEVICGLECSLPECEYKRFVGRSIAQIPARSSRIEIELRIKRCIDESQPIVRFEDGSRIEEGRMKPFEFLELKTKIKEILTKYLI